MNLASSETTDSAPPTSSGPQAANITNVDDEDDLEEGELKDDDDDSEDDDDNSVNHTNSTEPRRLLPIGVNSDNNKAQSVSSGLAGAAEPTGAVGDQPPKRKRKRVVRKVKRKIKVLKKVLKKKGDQQLPQQQQQLQQPQQQTPQQQQPQIQQQQQQQQQQPQAQHSMKQYNQQHTNQRNNHNSNNNVSSNNTTNHQSEPHQQQAPLLLPHIAQHQPHPPLLPVSQQQPPLQPLLPQTTAQHQVQPPIQPPQSTLASTNNLDSLWEQQILMLQELQRQQHAQIIRAAATDEDLRFLMQPQPQPQLQQPSQPQPQPQPLLPHMQQQPLLPHLQQHQPQILGQQQQQPNQTPSSPDDENGKSSYEAISKMLTLLRDSSEMTESDQNRGDQQNSSKLADSSDISYSLIPVFLKGIDYTAYKLMSKYEPKLKNDPRLYPRPCPWSSISQD